MTEQKTQYVPVRAKTFERLTLLTFDTIKEAENALSDYIDYEIEKCKNNGWMYKKPVYALIKETTTTERDKDGLILSQTIEKTVLEQIQKI